MLVEGIESKTLAMLTHLGKPFSYFDFLAATEHPVLKYHKVSDAECSVGVLGWGVLTWGQRGPGGAKQHSFFEDGVPMQ